MLYGSSFKFHTALYSTISPCSTKSYTSRTIKHSTTKDARSYEQASCKRKATPIILLVNVIRIGHENRYTAVPRPMLLFWMTAFSANSVVEISYLEKSSIPIQPNPKLMLPILSAAMACCSSVAHGANRLFSSQAKGCIAVFQRRRALVSYTLHLPTVRMCGKFKWNQPISLEMMQLMYLIAPRLWMT